MASGSIDKTILFLGVADFITQFGDLYQEKQDKAGSSNAPSDSTGKVTAGWGNQTDNVTLALIQAIEDGDLGITDHGSLSGLADTADHPYAYLIDGTRAVTGNATFNQAVTIDGDLGVGDGSSSADLVLDKADVDIATLQFHNAGVRRWYWYMTTGEDLAINRYAAGTGSFVDIPLTISQATGNFAFLHDISAVDGTFSGNVDVTSGTLDVGGLVTFDVGGSFNGDVDINGSNRTFALAGTGSNTLEVNKGGGNFGTLRLLTDGNKTWDIQNDNSENFEIKRYIADVFQADSLVISNADGRATFEAGIIAVDGDFSGTVTVDDVLNLDPQGSAPTGALGDMYCNSAGTLHFHNGVSWKTVTIV